MSKNKEIEKEYVDRLKEYAEKINFSSYFDSMATLSEKEHKMLVEGYKKDLQSAYDEDLEQADLYDLLLMEKD